MSEEVKAERQLDAEDLTQARVPSPASQAFHSRPVIGLRNTICPVAVWTNSVDEVGTGGRRDVPAVVSAMNRTMERAIEKPLTPPPATSEIKG
jgi:hypothetical protein